MDDEDTALDRRAEALTNGAWFCGIVFAVFLGITALSMFDPGLAILLLLGATGVALAVLLVLRAQVRRAQRDAES